MPMRRSALVGLLARVWGEVGEVIWLSSCLWRGFICNGSDTSEYASAWLGVAPPIKANGPAGDPPGGVAGRGAGTEFS